MESNAPSSVEGKRTVVYRLAVSWRVGIILGCVVCNSFAKGRDFNQHLPMMVNHEAPEDNTEKSPFLISGQNNWALKEADELPSPFMSHTLKEIKSIKLNEKEKLNVNGNTLPGEFSTSKSYREYKNKEILDEIRDKSKDRLTLLIIHDTFDYKNNTKSFERIYRDSKRKDIYGIFQIAYDYYYSKGFLNTLYGFGVGWGYSGGKGVFTNEDLDDPNSYTRKVRFSFHTIPLDLRMGVEFNLGRYFSLGAFGGPSVLGIIEYRSDREYGDKEKNKRQASIGYFSNVNLRVFMSSLIKRLGLKLYRQNVVNRFSINLEMRNHSYSQFKDKKMVIQGTSFGIGFTYDFM